MVPRTSFFELDVLELGAHHASDDDLHLLRDTESESTEEIQGSTGLRRIIVRQRWPRDVAGRLRTRGKARLVALRSIQRMVRHRGVLPALRAGSEATRSESSRSAALSTDVDNPAAGMAALLVPLHCLHDDHSGPAGAGHPPVRTGTDWHWDPLDGVPPDSHR